MKEYHKIQTVFQRDPNTNFKTLIMNHFSMPEFQYLQNNLWIFTEKVAGTNVRVMFNGNSITFAGKTDNAQLYSGLINKLNNRFLTIPKLRLFRELFPDGICLYGEGYGAKIQKGSGNYRSDQDFVLFDICIGDWWLERCNVEDIAQKLELDIVPIIGQGTLHDMVQLAQTGLNSKWGDFLAEGIVARPSVELYTRNGSRIITKIKYKDFIK